MKNFSFFLVFLLVAFLSIATKAEDPWTLEHGIGLPNSLNPAVTFSAVDVNVCWGINTANSQYIRTIDGGTNWTVSTVAGATGLLGSCISAIDVNIAFAALYDPSNATSGGVFKTTDGGTSWSKQTSAFPGSGGHPADIHFFDSNNGVVIGEPHNGNWEIYTTTNGGTQWIQVPSANIPPPASNTFTGGGLYASAGNYIWFGTYGGANNNFAMYRSTDRGLTWSKFNVPGNVTYSVAFKDSMNGLAVDCFYLNGVNQIVRTTDGGATWTLLQNVPTTPSTYFISYAKGTSGSYVITSHENIGAPQPTLPGSSYSTNDGSTWTQVSYLPLGPAVFPSASIGWGDGVNDFIWKWGSDLLSDIPTSGLQLWLKSDAGVTLDGSTVSIWGDQSGNGNDALQPNSDRQPLLINNGLNNEPVLHFDGIDDRLGLTGSTVMSQISLFLVFKIDSGLVGDEGTDPLPYFPIVLGNPNLDGKAYGLSMRNFFSGNSPNLIDPFDALDSWVHAEAPNIAAFNQWKVLNVVTNQTMWNTTVRSNGVDAVITPQGTSNTPLSVALGTPEGNTGIGGADNVPAGHLIFKGDIAEVVIYNTVLSDSQRSAVENYLTEKYSIVLGIEDQQGDIIPERFNLSQNYPNPFNPSTTIRFQVPNSSFVNLKVYDILGNEVATLVNEEKSAGSYEVNFNAAKLSSGMYLYTLQAGSNTQTKKLILMK